jgi:hypothetical protein
MDHLPDKRLASHVYTWLGSVDILSGCVHFFSRRCARWQRSG